MSRVFRFVAKVLTQFVEKSVTETEVGKSNKKLSTDQFGGDYFFYREQPKSSTNSSRKILECFVKL